MLHLFKKQNIKRILFLHTLQKEMKISSSFIKSFLESPIVIWIKDRFRIFCKLTSSHGFRYLVMPSFSLRERKLWFFMLVLCVLISGILLWYSLFLSSETPTTTVVESNHYSTWRMPFPAVTICNVNKISRKAIQSLTKVL